MRVRSLPPALRGLAVPTLGALAVVGVLLLGLFGILLSGVQALDDDAAGARAARETLKTSAALERSTVDVETDLRGYLLTGDPVAFRPLEAGGPRIRVEGARLVTMAGSPAQRARAVDLARRTEDYLTVYAARLRADGFALDNRRLHDATLQGKRTIDDLRARFRAFDAEEQRLAVVREERSEARARLAVVLAVAGLVGSAALLLVLGLCLQRLLIVPVRRVALAARTLAAGRLDARVPDGGRGEVGLLAGSFNAMADALARREEQLRVNGDRLQGILEHTTALISVKDRDGRYVLVNREWQAVCGLGAEAALGRTDEELFGAAVALTMRGTDQDVLRTGRTTEYETEHGERCYHTLKFPLIGPDGAPYAVALMSTDATERKRALGEAVEASRSKSEFLANMSHEIRTPLNGVIGMLELLLQGELPPGQREYAQTAALSGEALLGVINDILDFSKIEAGKLELDAHDFDLREAIEDTCEMLAPQAHGKGLELLAWIDEGVPPLVRGDRGRLRQVLTNLLANAIKFTAAGDVTLRVRSDVADGRARLAFEISDTGIGIEAEAVARLFDPFSQADTSVTRRYGGTGLGLAISRRLVELMGGELRCESTPGEGSTFRFTADAGVPAGIRPTRRPRASLPPDLHVLVVDDSATNRDIVEAYLVGRGVRVATAASGDEALGRLHAAMRAGDPFGLVVLDFHMPGMNGIELAEAISRAPSLRRPKLVLLTSTGDHLAAARAAGVGHHLTKPVRRARLLETVAEAVGAGEAAPPPPSPPAAVPAPAPASAQAMEPPAQRVLVVDDNAVNQLVIQGMLEKRGFAVDCAGDGREALDALEAGPYAIVFMDCQMPELDGYAATGRIREREAAVGGAGRLPVVAMTAHAMQGDRERCLAAGMDDYLAKPLRSEALDAVLERWLGTPPAAPAAAEPAATPAGDAADALVDEARMATFKRDYPEIVPQLVALFVDGTPPLLADLRTAAQAGDAQAVRRGAHKLKGSCQNIGATWLATLARELEADPEEGPPPEALERAFASTRTALEAALPPGPSPAR
jgi:two-component system, sensor histidine kinase and response regulator